MSNYTNEMEITFLDALLCTMEGQSPSKAIENQEKRGQADVVRNRRLPKKANTYTLPNEIFFISNTCSFIPFITKLLFVRSFQILKGSTIP